MARIAGVNIPTNKRVIIALQYIHGIGPKKAAELLTQYGTLEDVLAAGRFAAEAEDLRLYRRIAQMDASAPLPPLKPQTPTWAEASSFVRDLGLPQLAERLASVA